MYEYFTPVDNMRYPVNNAECALFLHAKRKGWKVTKRGWPDFFCISEKGRVILVEVKPRSKTTGNLCRLRYNQALTFEYFVSLGIECFVSDGVVFEKYDRQRHAPPTLLRKFQKSGNLIPGWATTNR